MSERTTNLKPCPFCGESQFACIAEFQWPPDGEGPSWKWGYHVVCSAAGVYETDGTPMRLYGCGCSSAWGEEPEDAIAAWNRRPAEGKA